MPGQNDVKIATWAHKLGYTIAGFAQDLYEGAEFMSTPSYISGDEPTEEELKYCTRGKVLEIIGATGVSEEEATNDYYDNAQLDRSYARQEGMPYEPDSAAARMAKIAAYQRHFIVQFVYETPDGIQISESFGRSYELRFKDPEAA